MSATAPETAAPEPILLTQDRQLELAWAAGFLDGEGCFSAYVQERGCLLKIEATQCDPLPLERLRTIFQVGHVRKSRSVSALGKLPHWCWRVASASDVMLVLDTVSEYLVVKSEQAKLLREIAGPMVSRKYQRLLPQERSVREALVEQLSALKRLETGRFNLLPLCG